ncbi:hypothetical protein Q765_11865 [Flavobacterium rivuli WB 3.3-2 = DSM 21788]|uniref:Uncharacterized protein n=1 Tax=Flavobacterium rivuli WB 3.3-2 = DSM 21788 TaxID=1121895 RepID=A0A0A2MDA8_9FLAO|nr:hypothetical protein [Flavobacterium rivuli]KGO86270.1 hypothetical protein Q765_11865 [Flavobacterium rivuli WB 3.3-2 = DSM 21788]
MIFESELMRSNIAFYNEGIQVSSSTTYFLQDKDREAINKILIDNTIVASTDTIALTDYSYGKKVYRFYIYIAVAVTVFTIVLTMFG